MNTSALRYLVLSLVVAFGLVWSGEIAPASLSGYISTAGAVRGRPATPVSYAGVARRTTRRVVATDAATPNCVTAYNAYGQPITNCY